MSELSKILSRIEAIEEAVKDQQLKITKLERFKREMQEAAKKASDAAIWKMISRMR